MALFECKKISEKKLLTIKSSQLIKSTGQSTTHVSWTFECSVGDLVFLQRGSYGGASVTSGFDIIASNTYGWIGYATDTTITGEVWGQSNAAGAIYGIIFDAPKTFSTITSASLTITNLNKDDYVILWREWASAFVQISECTNMDIYLIDFNQKYEIYRGIVLGHVTDNNGSITYNFGNYGSNPHGYAFILS